MYLLTVDDTIWVRVWNINNNYTHTPTHFSFALRIIRIEEGYDKESFLYARVKPLIVVCGMCVEGENSWKCNIYIYMEKKSALYRPRIGFSCTHTHTFKIAKITTLFKNTVRYVRGEGED